MIDLNDFRKRPEAYEAACKKKRINFDIKAFLALDAEYRERKTKVENLRSQQNAFSKDIGKLKSPEKDQKFAEMKALAEGLKVESQSLKEFEEKWHKMQLLIPGIPLDRVPEGKDDTENVEIKRWGTKPEFFYKPKSHAELGQSLDIIDIERGVKVSGSRFYYLKGDGARLQHAVLSYTMDFLHQRGFTLMDPPHIVKRAAMEGTGFFPGAEDQAYHLDERDPDEYLIGTSEVPVCAYHTDEILDASKLPLRYAGYSPCYRREAGTYGKDTSGLYRIHQFYKVEQVVFCKNDPTESAKMHAELLGNAEALMQSLGLHYRVVDVCAGDMGQGQVYKNDIETWMPSRNNFGETHSCSTLHDFQARRLSIRYKDENGKNLYCHTLNNTCLASPRFLIPLLEVYQSEDGSVRIPEVLRPYMKGQTEIRKTK